MDHIVGISAYKKMKFYLASKSPRRHQLLKQLDINFEIVEVNIDEDWDKKEIARDYVTRLALEKARSGIKKINDDVIVLGADTAVVLDDIILGKAENINEAAQMLRSLSGRTHHVYSAIALINNKEDKTDISVSRVSFKPLTDHEIERYCKTEEPLGKAGAYAIQGNAAKFIERLDGSYSGVMGLPLYETWQLIQTLYK